MQNLTKKQKIVLDFIEQYNKENSYSPSIRDICFGCGLSSTSTVFTHLKNLEKLGYIERGNNKSRAITVAKHEVDTEEGLHSPASTNGGFVAYSKTIDLPVIGTVAAGEPIYADQNIVDTLTLPVDIVGDSASFMLKVRGDSMVEIGINDKDYVVVREQQTANNGDVVVAILDDSATVKTYYREADRIRLQPENSSLEPIYTRDCTIAGKVVAVFRRL